MKPKIICHMMSSVDGRLIGDRWSKPFDGKESDDLFAPYYKVSDDMDVQAWMVGRKTVQEHYVPETFNYENHPPAKSFETFSGKWNGKRSVIVIDPKGKIAYKEDNIDGSNIITILSERVSEEYLSLLREKGISYIFAGPTGDDIESALNILADKFNIKSIVLEGGGIINGKFLKAGLIDELSLMIYPGVDGLAGIPAIFEYVGDSNENPAEGQSLELMSVNQLTDGVVWLYYKFHKL